MPDGDRFCWGVRGRGARTLLNLMRANTRADLVADQAANVVGEQCKSPAVQRVVLGVMPLLSASLPLLDTDASKQLPGTEEVRRRLRLLRGDAGGAPFAMVVLNAAENAYHRLQGLGQSLSNAVIRREFLQASVEGILGHAVFNAKRHDNYTMMSSSV
jgi:hypothetical protein